MLPTKYETHNSGDPRRHVCQLWSGDTGYRLSVVLNRACAGNTRGIVTEEVLVTMERVIFRF